LKQPFGTGANLIEILRPDQMVGKQEFGYLYNYEKGFRVLKANLMYDILDL
jgi:hypothetical protein